MSDRDKRRHPRRRIDRSVYCYVDGSRLDVKTEDVSEGGMFLRTAGGLPPIGSLLGVVFLVAESTRPSTFLFGRVVRMQEAPVRGVGLRWEKAVAMGPPAELSGFLETNLGILGPRIDELPQPGDGPRKCVYHFPPPADEVARAPALPFEPEPRRRSPATRIERRPVREDVGRLDPYAGRESGAITSLIEQRALQAPASVPADLVVGDAPVPGRITRLGLSGMSVTTPWMPIAKSTEVTVRFAVRLEETSHPIECACRLLRVDPHEPGLDLEILSVQDGPMPGAFKAYVKALQFRNLANT
jgi:hypothetical protein